MAAQETDDERAWRKLAADLVARQDGVAHGKMMSSDAVTYGGKVFAFYTGTGRFAGMGVRLGRAFDVAGLKLSRWEYLAPFKSKPPMKDWILAGAEDRKRWPELARLALKAMKAGAKADG